MVHYRCIATGHEAGWVEVVRHSVTLSDIQKEAGGVSGIFNEKTLANWIRKHNPSGKNKYECFFLIIDLEYKIAVDNFIRTCAGGCVATYVLGIGDRHNDNLMIKNNG